MLVRLGTLVEDQINKRLDKSLPNFSVNWLAGWFLMMDRSVDMSTNSRFLFETFPLVIWSGNLNIVGSWLRGCDKFLSQNVNHLYILSIYRYSYAPISRDNLLVLTDIFGLEFGLNSTSPGKPLCGDMEQFIIKEWKLGLLWQNFGYVGPCK